MVTYQGGTAGNEKIKSELDDYALQSRRKMQICINKSHKNQANVTVKEIKKINEAVEDLARKKQSLQDAVKHEFLTNKMEFDWMAYKERKEKMLKPKLFSRPTRNELIWLDSGNCHCVHHSFCPQRIR